MLVRAAFAAVGAFVSELIPAQGIRSVPQGERDLVEAEAEVDHHSDPRYSGHDPRDFDCEFDPWDPVEVDPDARCPICSRTPGPAAPGAAVTPAGDIPPSPAGRPPHAELTNGDLVRASQIVRAYCDRIGAYGFRTEELRALASRLSEAGTPDPNP